MAGDTAECDYSGQTSNGIGPSAESKKEDAVAGLPKLDQRSVAVDDIARNSKSSRLSDLIMYPSQEPPAEMAAVCRRT